MLILKIMQDHGKNTGEMRGPVGKECADLGPRTAADAGSMAVQCMCKSFMKVLAQTNNNKTTKIVCMGQELERGVLRAECHGVPWVSDVTNCQLCSVDLQGLPTSGLPFTAPLSYACSRGPWTPLTWEQNRKDKPPRQADVGACFGKQNREGPPRAGAQRRRTVAWGLKARETEAVTESQWVHKGEGRGKRSMLQDALLFI